MQVHGLEGDKRLIKELQDDNVQAFQTIFNAYWKDLYKLSYYRLKDQNEAEDLVQDVFTDFWDKRHQIEIDTSLKSYLQGSVKYRIIRLFSRGNLHKTAIEHLIYRMTEIESTILDVLSHNDLERTISQTIHTFPKNMKDIFLLRAEEYTIKEIADALGLAEQSVKNNISDGLKRLRIALIKTDPDIKGSFYMLLAALMLEK
ncbi:RNA polymerase sigma factor [Pedobacter metabolipauper]|uniref:RNA polymerase sigma (SigX) subunit n=1 Tax=Pedobacter metabolipauper TaxID=425513 RepID=A0A4R6SV71_9SPHI|nr:sigma-70 family RNA polymerase sigma factor [Pedobacter metabolipauper]TDQ08650.1 RNA polymerase sigma (SigX) subunit [Pedobacter metabolipauper]